MPSQYRNKIYLANTAYHIYNRGVNKQTIFHSNKDYLFYLKCLKEYLTPKEELISELVQKKMKKETMQKKLAYLLQLKNYSAEISLLAFCLMPNHIHLIVWQKDERAIARFMQSLQTRYGKYHAKRYSRIGPLYQDRYRAKPILDKKYLLDVSRYVHLNPVVLGIPYYKYRWVSTCYYKNERATAWLKIKIILEEFSISPIAKGYSSYYDWLDDRPAL